MFILRLSMKDQKHMVWSLWCKCKYITLILAQEKQRRHQDVAISLIIYPCIFGNNINQIKGSIILWWSTTTTSTPNHPSPPNPPPFLLCPINNNWLHVNINRALYENLHSHYLYLRVTLPVERSVAQLMRNY